MDASDIILLIGDIVAIVVIAFVILSSPIRYFIRKRRCCINTSCCGKKEAAPEQEVIRRAESVLKYAYHMPLSFREGRNTNRCSLCRDVENHEGNKLISDELAGVDHDANIDDLNAIKLPAIESQSPRASVVARTGSQILRRNSGTFENILSESVRRSQSILRSDSVLRRSGSMQVY
jgi:hypothetical protein